MRLPIEYSLLGDGKRIRPILCLAANFAVSGKMENALPAACAIEMIHAYSLIHDDLPALDDDSLRRGRPTCHIQFTESTAILAGDALLNMAFETLTEAALHSAPDKMPEWLKIIAFIAKSSGSRGMIEGQARDIEFEGTTITQNALEEMHLLKTGALIQAAVYSGAVIEKASETHIFNLLEYAKYIGLAFQVVDDILNVDGDSAIMGKAIGTDNHKGKNTYPALIGLTESRKYAKRLIAQALHVLSGFDNNADPLRAIARYVIDRNR
jgi:geranylgeranyl diphosphate synthase type II